MSAAMLHIEKRNFGEIVILDCSGRIVFRRESEVLLEAVAAATGHGQCVLLNLSAVHAVDGGGLGMLVFLHQFAAATGCSLKLCAMNRRVSALLELTKLNTVLDVYRSEDQAIESFFRSVA